MRKVALFLVLSVVLVAAIPQANGEVAGTLYAGGTNPCCVYKYLGGTNWATIGTFPNDYSVLCLVVYNDTLYAGTMSNSNIFSSAGKVWKYLGGTSWTQVGSDLDNVVNELVVYHGDLYAGTAWNRAKLYKYVSPNSWDVVVHSRLELR